jgi:CheY-like chemotaxis protein
MDERRRPVARILIADDNADVRDLLVALFRLRRHDAVAFANGPALLADLRQRRADICLIDWMMPGMDGPAVLSDIRDDPDPRVAATPVAILTSDDRADHRYVARQAGAQTFINKATPLARMFDSLAPYLPVSRFAHPPEDAPVTHP